MPAKKKSGALKKKATQKSNELQFAVDLKHSGLKRDDFSGFKNKITKALAQAAAKKPAGKQVVIGEPFVKILHVKQIFGRKIK
jgi:hypothetical protein